MAGSVTQTKWCNQNGNFMTLLLACVGDSVNGSVPDTALDADFMADAVNRGFYLLEYHTWPGATAPDDASDFTLEDSNGMDVLGTAGTNGIDATTTVRAFPKNTAGSSAYWPAIDETLTLKVTNQATGSAIWNIKLVFVKDQKI